MSDVNTQLIERYQQLLQSDPKSKVFATLCEAYRKLGMHAESLKVAQEGLKHHPHFASGHVAIARSYLDVGEYEKALKHLTLATELAPENILAHSLKGECLLHLKNPKEALQSFKLVLFYNPSHEKAVRAVKKLESLTADEYEEDLFAMHKISSSSPPNASEDLEVETAELKDSDAKNSLVLERFLSLADAFITRNDFDRALESLKEAERQLGPLKPIEQRRHLIHSRRHHLDLSTDEVTESALTASSMDRSVEPAYPSSKDLYAQEKIDYLNLLLQRLEANQRTGNRRSHDQYQ